MDWNIILKPLFKKYGKRKHPLEFKNTYQLVVMVVLSAQTTDKMVNSIADRFFAKYPSMKHLASAKPEDLFPFIKSIRSYRKKAEWLVSIAKTIGNDKNIPLILEDLVKLPGIGRKSANVIIFGAGGQPQGIFMDLHVLRVVERLGITPERTPDKIEKVLMKYIDRKNWHAAGISFSFLGRELCRPTEPVCNECPLSTVCEYNSKLN